MTLDITDDTEIAAAADRIAGLDVLVNNAGVSLPGGVDDREAIEMHLAVNLFGTHFLTLERPRLITQLLVELCDRVDAA